MSQLFEELVLQFCPEKDTSPLHEMPFSGVCVNTLTVKLSVPDFRLRELHDL